MNPRRTQTALLVVLATAGGVCASCSPTVAPAPSEAGATEGDQAVASPASCDATVEPGQGLQAAADATASGATLCLRPGVHHGPLKVTRSLHLWGPREAIVGSGGDGTTIEILADHSSVRGLTVDGSGGRFDLLDAAVRVEAHDVAVEGLEIRNALFGILVEKSARITVASNRISGNGEGPLGLRGDPIRLWETTDSRVEGNRVTSGRDIVVWYSSRNVIARNTVSGGRYGTHFMYSHHNDIVANRYADDVVGVFLMYSHDVRVLGNHFIGASGAAGMGLGIKESGNLTVAGNAFVGNTTGCYLDTSPLQVDHRNTFSGNLFALGDAGVVFHSSERRNTFDGNTFRDNADQVRVEGGGHARDVAWRGNYFDDYQGYDLDDDGIGDVPYELRGLAGSLVQQQPQLAILRGTPSLSLVDAAGEVAPILSPRKLLVDSTPAMAPPPLSTDTPDTGEAADAR